MPRLPVTYIALPPTWPGRQRPDGWKPIKSPFKFKGWTRVENELVDEVSQINGRDLTIAIDVRNPGHFRQDGTGILADARPASQRIVVSFTRPDGRRLVFPCDTYQVWQDNVWAVRLSLEALRSVDRHGVTAKGEQYQGFAALPPAGGTTMTTERAFEIVAELSGFEAPSLAFPAVRSSALRIAASKSHPDSGGSDVAFQEFQEAKRVLEKHYAERS